MARDPKYEGVIPHKVLIHEIARQYNKLPYEIKQMPDSELTEMLEMAQLKAEIMNL